MDQVGTQAVGRGRSVKRWVARKGYRCGLLWRKRAVFAMKSLESVVGSRVGPRGEVNY